jgi:predicted site-specific integrase-resolvase
MRKWKEEPNREYLTPYEVADLLRCSIKTVYNYTVRGILKRYSFGGRKVYYLRSEVESSMFGI